MTTDTPKVERVLMLGPSITVHKQFHDDLLALVQGVIPVLEPGVPYTLEDLCGIGVWSGLSTGQRRIAGKVMAHWVVHQIVPLRFADRSCRTPKRYVLQT